MANNYTLLSTFYPLRPDQLEEAKKVLREAAIAWVKPEDYPFCDPVEEDEASWKQLPGRIELEGSGIWFGHDEDADPWLVANLISALQKAFSPKEGGKPFVFSYCYACSKPRVDEFGGGAYAVLPDGEILHSDPRDVVLKRAVIQIWKKARRKNWWELKTKVGRKNWWEVKHE